uniref:Zinc finger BED-type containing 5 n=1 Tax=Molossus molossus TaxID=27622 RepID=A0A7J8ERG6_MOLMO|nr:hypothetical protein HJG59_008700 [Molossus molossus]
MKPHTIAEDLLLPAAKDIVRVMIRDEFVTKLSAIFLSNDTVHRRIDDMSADILEMITTAYNVFDTVEISWEKVCSVCTDSAPAMLGCLSGFQCLVLNESPKVVTTHCMIHRQILATKTLTQELQEVMKSVISSVNFVKASTLNS